MIRTLYSNYSKSNYNNCKVPNLEGPSRRVAPPSCGGQPSHLVCVCVCVCVYVCVCLVVYVCVW